jgi:putative nucleotidyltransferase with HDIG domain
MLDLSGNTLLPPSEVERRRRSEAVRHHKADPRKRAATARSEVANLRCELEVAAHLTTSLASTNDVTQMAEMVVTELNEQFAFYLVAIHRLDGDVLHLIAGRGELAGVMNEFLLVEQSVNDGVNGRVVRAAKTELVPDTRLDPDYVVRDPETDPRSELSVPIISDGAVWGVLNIEAVEPDAFNEAHAVLAETIAGSLGAAIHRAHLIDELHHSFTTTLAALTGAVEAKDDKTALHGNDVAELAERIATRLGLSVTEARDIRYAALLHDVGKIAVPSEILLKPAALTEEEWKVMRSHAEIGAELVSRIDAFAHIAGAVRHHHERIDGKGYPDGLRGEKIPLAARIIAACDTFDAITSDRPYRRARSVEEARAELTGVAGSQLDPAVVEALFAELG